MKKYNLMGILIVFFSLSCSSTFASAPMKLGAIDFAPFFVVDENNNLDGITVKILKGVTGDSGIETEMELLPVPRLYDSLRDQSVNLFVGLKGIKTYDENVLYSSKWILKIKVASYTFDPEVMLPSKKEDFKNSSVILIRGYNYLGMRKFLENPESNMQIFDTNDHVSALRMLKGNRAKFLLNYQGPMLEVISNLNKEEKNGVRENIMLTIPTYFILSKTYPNAEAVMKQLEVSFDKLYTEGKFDDLPVELNSPK